LEKIFLVIYHYTGVHKTRFISLGNNERTNSHKVLVVYKIASQMHVKWPIAEPIKLL